MEAIISSMAARAKASTGKQSTQVNNAVDEGGPCGTDQIVTYYNRSLTATMSSDGLNNPVASATGIVNGSQIGVSVKETCCDLASHCSLSQPHPSPEQLTSSSNKPSGHRISRKCLSLNRTIVGCEDFQDAFAIKPDDIVGHEVVNCSDATVPSQI
ncbi:hypothetical protein [Rhizobium bangladeshense]|uniref:hypothetical protein n=1 Tax=Rhizobium bangladeshense TaxID=1138189 RepID=UPI001C82AA13|nr:hypothetical protein [Rhizobium bangladeshense]MBX4901200.1 hypothetical protein [Rhizobium bangladeshense]MBX4915288.1 hypothetical protein [Rhizobium bangladeshense]MBX4922208.1 hypothetical protein [Rhizobium bangladeshense]MBY3599409.1 hypothetical protein [Rhizobium bangladeshense]